MPSIPRILCQYIDSHLHEESHSRGWLSYVEACMVHEASADFGSKAVFDFMGMVAEAAKVLDVVSIYCIVRSYFGE